MSLIVTMCYAEDVPSTLSEMESQAPGCLTELTSFTITTSCVDSHYAQAVED